MIRCAEAPCAASIIASSSTSASFGVMPSAMLAAVDWMRKTSARRNVVRDHRTGASVCIVPDFYGSDEGGVNPGVDIASDLCPMLAVTVVVRRDRGGPEVAPLAHLGVADVGEVRHLGAGSDL